MPLSNLDSNIKYLFKNKPVKLKNSLRYYSPSMYSSEGTTGWCGWRTTYQVMNQVRRTFFTNTPQLSLDFVASMWAIKALSATPTYNIYGVTILPRGAFSLLYLYGTLPYDVWGDGVRYATPEEMQAALEYKAMDAYECPYYGKQEDKDAGYPVALAKELIDSGFAFCASVSIQAFPFNGGDMGPQPLGLPGGYPHVFTVDEYDDSGYNGEGMISGTTNGVGVWKCRYRDFNNYCSPSCFIKYVTPPTYPFPTPLPTDQQKSAAVLLEEFEDTLQEQLIPISSSYRGTISMPWTLALVQQLETIAQQARAEVSATVTPTVTPTPTITPAPTPVEYIINNLPAGVSGPSGNGSVEFTGLWTNSGTAGKYNNDGLYSCDIPTFPDARVPPTPLSTYTFKSPPLKAGKWKVFVWWAQYMNRSVRVPITVNGVTTEVNQQINGSVWNSLGEITVTENQIATVTISNANGQAAADAVKFLQVL